MTTESEVATKAPKSDTAEQSIIPGDTKVDQGAASLGEHCTTDRPTPAGLSSTGELTKFNDVEVYVSKPSDYPHSPSKLLLLLTSGTGIHSKNNQLQADKYAENGYLVIMPDQFGGDAITSTTTPASPTTAEGESTTVLEQVKLGLASVAKSFTIDMWLARHTPEKVLPILDKVLNAVEEEYADAISNGGGIYAVGYCFGAKYVLLLASSLHKDVAQGQRNPESQAEEGMVKQSPRVKAGAVAHGTMVTKEDLAGVDAPISIIAVKEDPLFPEEVLEAGMKAIKEKNGVVVQEVYPDVPHGFAVLGDYEEEHIKEKQKDAFERMLKFLQSH